MVGMGRVIRGGLGGVGRVRSIRPCGPGKGLRLSSKSNRTPLRVYHGGPALHDLWEKTYIAYIPNKQLSRT